MGECALAHTKENLITQLAEFHTLRCYSSQLQDVAESTNQGNNRREWPTLSRVRKTELLDSGAQVQDWAKADSSEHNAACGVCAAALRESLCWL